MALHTQPFWYFKGPLVFAIRHRASGRTYVGRATASDAGKRVRQHRDWLRRGEHHCRAMQDDWNRLGEKSFEFELIATCASALHCCLRQQVELDARVAGELLYNERVKVRRAVGASGASTLCRPRRDRR